MRRISKLKAWRIENNLSIEGVASLFDFTSSGWSKFESRHINSNKEKMLLKILSFYPDNWELIKKQAESMSTQDVLMAVGRKQRRGKSLNQIAKECGIGASSLSTYQNGNTGNIQHTTLMTKLIVCVGLGVFNPNKKTKSEESHKKRQKRYRENTSRLEIIAGAETINAFKNATGIQDMTHAEKLNALCAHWENTQNKICSYRKPVKKDDLESLIRVIEEIKKIDDDRLKFSSFFDKSISQNESFCNLGISSENPDKALKELVYLNYKNQNP